MKMQTRVIVADDAGSAPAGSGVTVASPAGVGPTGANETGANQEDSAPCPRCSNDAPVRLEKADPQANTCYRCRTCGHIFSPRD